MEFERARLMNNINTLIKDKNIKIGELENSIGISTDIFPRCRRQKTNQCLVLI